MTNKVKQFIVHKCGLCKGYNCGSNIVYDIEDFDDNADYYCDTFGMEINGRTIRQCEDEDCFDSRFDWC